MAVGIDTLQIEIEANSAAAVNGVDALAASLQKLKNAVGKGGITGLNSVSNQLKKLVENVNGGTSAGNKIAKLASALTSLSKVEKAAGLSSAVNALKKLPEISKNLEAADLGKFASQMRQVASAIRPLADEMQKVSNGFAAFPIRIQKLIASNTALSASNRSAGKSFNFLGTDIKNTYAKLGVYTVAFRRVATVMAGWVQKSNDYVENLNLFTVAMGDGAKTALAYAENVRDAMGIDPSEFIRNWGVFKQILSGFGVAEDAAYKMSQNLTQIGYDISSFFNINIEESMQKVQSGIAGELEPLRRLGYALDVATLQEIAYKHGIDMSINAMNQAQKSQLRYLAIMGQSTNVMGDMARTIMTPANAMRILQQELTQLARAAGNALVPALMAIIPAVQAVVEILTEAIQAIANLFGFQITEIDYSGLDGVSQSGSEAEDALGGAAGAAKDLKNAVLGIDELNVLSPDQGGGGGGAGNLFGEAFDLDLPVYDFLKNIDEKVGDIKDKLKNILNDYVVPIGASLALWKFANFMSDLAKAGSELSGLKKIAATGIVMTLEFLLVGSAYSDFLSEKGGLKDLIKSLMYTALGSAALYLIWGTAGAALGIAVGVTAILTSLSASIKRGEIKVGSFKEALTTAVVTALGGIGGALAAKSLGFGTTTGAVIGMTLAAALTLSVTNVSAIAGGQYSGGSFQSVFNMAVSSALAGIAGATLLPALGIATAGVGFVIGVGVALVLSIKAVSMAEDERQNSIISEAFYDGLGVSIEEVGRKFGDLIQSASEANGPILIAWDSILQGRDSIDQTTGRIENLALQVSNGYKSISENMPLIKQEFDDLYNDTYRILDQEATMIYSALAGSVGDALRDAGVDLNEYVSVINSVAGGAKQELDELRKKNEELYSSILSGAAPEGAIETFLSNAQRIAELSGIDTSGLDTFRDKLTELIPEDIDWNTDDLSAVFESISREADTAKGTIEDAAEGLTGALDHLKSLTADPEEIKVIDSIIEAVNTDKETKLAQLDTIVSDFVSGLQSNLLESVQGEYDAALEDWNALSPMEKAIAGGSQEQYISDFLDKYKTNVVTPITDQIATVFGEDDAWATEAMETLLSTMFNKVEQTDMFGGGVLGYSTTLAATVQEALDQVMPQYMTDAGQNIAGALADSITANGILVIDAVTGMASNMNDAFEGAQEMGSPSKVYEDYGLYIVQGFANGITENAGLVETAMTNMLNQLQNKMQQFTNNCRSAINSMLSDIAFTMSSVSVSKGGTVSFSGSSHKDIPMLASGGFPAEGQMFVAREAGPELVGTIGNRTAVANNDQITGAIRQAVYAAMTEAMAQQQQQPIIVENKVSLDGKQITSNVEKHQRDRGVSIMSGGVMAR